MAKVNINGCEIYYEVHGQGDPLVLIMGLRRNVEWWFRQIPALSEHFQVIAFDNRGAGRSDKPVMEYSMRLFADDTAGLMKALDISKAHILGISMGGYLAQELALNYPAKVKSLVLGCTGCGGDRAVIMSPERMEKFTANKGLTPEEILRKDMDIYFSDDYVDQHPEKIKEFVEISMRHYQPADAFLRQFDACLRHDTGDRLNQLLAPTLIMTGDDDPLVPPQNSHILKDLIPGADLSVFAGGRHCFFIETADQFNKKAVDFLKANS
ncbi:MAG: alpha/beta fold hydrolase [Deltaproteobacteria bacterium]|nr:alpha/beta fold hydrolase [Deltaproteobacteria bacterium]MBW2657000.1 alpha/beta fold hydrolase [Deltaproteobacteria bacterium]